MVLARTAVELMLSVLAVWLTVDLLVICKGADVRGTEVRESLI